MLRGSCFTDNADFGVEHDAVLLVDALLNLVDEAADVGGGGVAGGIDDEAGVLSRDLGAADLEALEAGLLDQGAGEVTLGRLKVLPALGISRGCLLSRRSVKSSILARMASLSPG